MDEIGKVERNDKGRMVQTMAKEIVLQCELSYTHQKMAELCGTTATTISRWKDQGRADASKIEPLVNFLNQKNDNNGVSAPLGDNNKSLQSVPMEDLLKEINRRGFNLTLTSEKQ